MSGRKRLIKPRVLTRDSLKEVNVLLEDARTEFQSLLLHETAQMANSLFPEHRLAAREILGASDIVTSDLKLGRETLARIRSMKRVMNGDQKTIDAFAKEITKDKDADSEGIRRVAAKLVSICSVVLIKRHVSNPDKAMKEKELVDALESVDHRVVGPMKEDLEKIVRVSPYESVKRAAMALLSRVNG